MRINKTKTFIENTKLMDKLNDDILYSMRDLKELSSCGINYYLLHKNLDIKIIDEIQTNLYENNDSLISFLMTSWNRRELLEIAINSILSLNHNNLQIIIVDDGSKDSTDAFIDELKKNNLNVEIVYIKTAGGQGPGLNKRLGFNYVKGEYVVFMDDDDYYINPNWTNIALQKFNQYPNLSAVYFNSYKLFMENNSLEFPKNFRMNHLGIVEKTFLLENLMINITKPNSTFPAIFKVEKLKSVDIDKMKILNDTSIYLRGAVGGDVYISDDIIGVYRIHSGSMAKNLSIDYILDNVNEKINLLDKLPVTIDKDKWLYQQTVVTLFHYLQESRNISWKSIITWSKNLSRKYQIKFILNIPKERLSFYKNKIRRK